MYILGITVDVGFGHMSSLRFMSGEVHQISMSDLVWPSVFFLLAVLQWSEPKAKRKEADGISVFIKAIFFCRFGAYGQGLETASSSHGDSEDRVY
jgi:hypothetical protein